MKPGMPDMGAVGEAAAKLPDPQAVMFYFLLVIIAILVVKDIVGSWRHARTADRFAESASKLAAVMQNDSLQVTVQLALVQRELADAKTERAESATEATRARDEIKNLLIDARDLLEKPK